MSSTATYDCQQCGACCETFRVSFYWSEADDAPGGTVPVALTEPLGPFMRCMQGTYAKTPRCVALDGKVGEGVACRIYEQRSSACRELQPGEDKCIRARQRHGLPV